MAIASGTQGTCSWNIDDNGKLTIKPTSGSSGDLQFGVPISLDSNPYPWGTYASRITSVVLSGSISNTPTEFFTVDNDFNSMFSYCTKLTSVSGLGSITGAEYLQEMFRYCVSLKSIDISALDVTSVKNMHWMFAYSGLTSITGIKSTNQLIDAGSMFEGCSSLTSLDITQLNTTNCFSSRLADGIGSIFARTPLLSTIKIGNNFYIKPYSQYTPDEYQTESASYMGSAKNLTNGIIVTSDEAFSELTNAQRAGTWQRNVLFTYSVSAYRSTSGTADEDGENATFDIRWATDATTTDRVFRIYQKEAGAVSYPTSPVLTQNVTGNSGNTTLTINNIGDNAYDFKVEFYDGTDTYLAFPSIQTNIRLITIDETGNVCLYLDTSASSGTTDAKLYEAIVALGWQGDVLV